MSAGPLHKPTPLPQSQEAQAAWTAGWWQGKVIGFALGMATAVLFGWLRWRAAHAMSWAYAKATAHPAAAAAATRPAPARRPAKCPHPMQTHCTTNPPPAPRLP